MHTTYATCNIVALTAPLRMPQIFHQGWSMSCDRLSAVYHQTDYTLIGFDRKLLANMARYKAPEHEQASAGTTSWDVQQRNAIRCNMLGVVYTSQHLGLGMIGLYSMGISAY